MLKSWYAVRVEPGRELYLADILRPEWIDRGDGKTRPPVLEYLSSDDANICIPMCVEPTVMDIKIECRDEFVNHRDELTVSYKTIEETQSVNGLLIPGYLFIRTENVCLLVTELEIISERRGIWVAIMPSAHLPSSVSDEEIRYMRDECTKLVSKTGEAPDLSWMIGQTFRIQGGTFAGFKGPCARISKNGNPEIEIRVFNNLTAIPIPLRDIHLRPLKVSDNDHVVKSRMFGYKKKVSA